MAHDEQRLRLRRERTRKCALLLTDPEFGLREPARSPASIAAATGESRSEASLARGGEAAWALGGVDVGHRRRRAGADQRGIRARVSAGVAWAGPSSHVAAACGCETDAAPVGKNIMCLLALYNWESVEVDHE